MGKRGQFAELPRKTRHREPLPAAIVMRTVIGARMDDPGRIDHWRGRNNRGLGDHGRGRRHDGRLDDYGRGRRHDSGRSDHNGVGRDDVMRKRNRRRRQSDNARREAKSATVVVMVMSSREYACSGRHRKSHDNDFLRVHDLPRLSVSVEHHCPTYMLGNQQPTI